MTCQCRIIDYNKYTTLIGDVVGVGLGGGIHLDQGIYENSVHPTQFCYKKVQLFKKNFKGMLIQQKYYSAINAMMWMNFKIITLKDRKGTIEYDSIYIKL